MRDNVCIGRTPFCDVCQTSLGTSCSVCSDNYYLYPQKGGFCLYVKPDCGPMRYKIADATTSSNIVCDECLSSDNR